MSPTATCFAMLVLQLSAPAFALVRRVDEPRPPESRGPVVFVCEHGNVKSLIAREWFNRLAAERGLDLRAVSRGLSPEIRVPPAIAERLRGDGFDVSGFEPRGLEPADVADAARLVVIGAEPPPWASHPGLVVERWDGIPPASERYEASRDALREKIAALVELLARSAAGR
jgi:arsenate reductase (thioredoxin)